jgi:RHS repeat-associated protein
VIKRIEYDSFGNIIDDTNTSFMVPFGFAGGLNDNDTGIVRFGYRNYDPDVGRWTAKDPIFLDGGETDFYGYCLNNPINAIDPLGLIVEADPFHPLPNIPTSNLTKGQKGALFKTGLGAGLIIGGSLTLPEGAPFIAVGIPMLAEGLTLDVVEFGFHGDTNDIPSTWEVFGTVAEQIYNLNNSCPVK